MSEQVPFEYYNDDFSLLRLSSRYGAEQFSPAEADWKPGGLPSFRAAHLSYEKAKDLAYRLTNSFGKKANLQKLDIGPEYYTPLPGAAREGIVKTLKVKLLQENSKLPTRANHGDGGLDLYSTEEFELPAGERRLAKTGIAIALPPGSVGLVLPRSGLAAKHGISIVNAPGLIDAGFRGEVQIILLNTGKDNFQVEEGMRIAQLLITPFYTPQIEVVKTLEETERGSGGFGSSGS